MVDGCDSKEALLHHTTALSRIYPHGNRVNSCAFPYASNALHSAPERCPLHMRRAARRCGISTCTFGVPLCLFTHVPLRARSNYNPFPCLARGAQLVALNYQTNDVALQCYRGIFRQNGGCGYVLRPLCLRDSSALADASVPSPLSPQPMLHAYRLTLLCGRLLPKPSEVRRGVHIEPTSACVRARCGMHHLPSQTLIALITPALCSRA